MSFLINHSTQVYNTLPKKEKVMKGLAIKHKFYRKLPKMFTKKEYQTISQELAVNDKTAQRYIKSFKDQDMVISERHNCYSKVNKKKKEMALSIYFLNNQSWEKETKNHKIALC